MSTFSPSTRCYSLLCDCLILAHFFRDPDKTKGILGSLLLLHFTKLVARNTGTRRSATYDGVFYNILCTGSCPDKKCSDATVWVGLVLSGVALDIGVSARAAGMKIM
jgi:hypothetical protein